MSDARFAGGPLDGRTLTLPVKGAFASTFTHHGFSGVRGTGYVKYLYQLVGTSGGVGVYVLEESDESVLRTVQSGD